MRVGCPTRAVRPADESLPEMRAQPCEAGLVAHADIGRRRVLATVRQRLAGLAPQRDMLDLGAGIGDPDEPIMDRALVLPDVGGAQVAGGLERAGERGFV